MSGPVSMGLGQGLSTWWANRGIQVLHLSKTPVVAPIERGARNYCWDMRNKLDLWFRRMTASHAMWLVGTLLPLATVVPPLTDSVSQQKLRIACHCGRLGRLATRGGTFLVKSG
jgi:hypothetical protein